MKLNCLFEKESCSFDFIPIILQQYDSQIFDAGLLPSITKQTPKSSEATCDTKCSPVCMSPILHFRRVEPNRC